MSSNPVELSHRAARTFGKPRKPSWVNRRAPVGVATGCKSHPGGGSRTPSLDATFGATESDDEDRLCGGVLGRCVGY